MKNIYDQQTMTNMSFAQTKMLQDSGLVQQCSDPWLDELFLYWLFLPYIHLLIISFSLFKSEATWMWSPLRSKTFPASCKRTWGWRWSSKPTRPHRSAGARTAPPSGKTKPSWPDKRVKSGEIRLDSSPALLTCKHWNHSKIQRRTGGTSSSYLSSIDKLLHTEELDPPPRAGCHQSAHVDHIHNKPVTTHQSC